MAIAEKQSDYLPEQSIVLPNNNSSLMEREYKDNSSKYTLKEDSYEQYNCQSDKSSTPYYAQTECNLPLEEILKEDERILKRFGSNNKKPEPPQKIDVSSLYDKASLLGLGFEKLGKSILHLSSRLTNIDDLSSKTIEWWEALLSGVPYLGGIVEPDNGRILFNLGNEGYALLTGDTQSVFEYMEMMSQASNNTALFWQFPLLVGLEPDVAIEAEDLMLKSGDKDALDKYHPEVEEDNTTESKLKSTTKKEKSAYLNNSEQIESLNVSELTNVEKLTESIKRSAKALPGEVADELQAIFTPQTLATMVSVFAVYVAAHATGIGQAMDIGMLIAGGVFFGMDAFTIFKDIAGFANAVNAQDEAELDKAGQHLASAVAKIGVDAVMTLLSSKVAKKVGGIEEPGTTTGDMDDIKRPTASQGRNTEPLTEAQIAEVKAYSQELGIPEESFAFTQFNTAYGNLFGMERVQVGTDVAPLTNPPQSGITANSRISIKGSLAHEWVGHGGAGRAGRAFDRGELGNPNKFNIALDEAQASIRAARFAPGLTPLERYTLLRDGIARLRKEGISIKEVRHLLYIDQP